MWFSFGKEHIASELRGIHLQLQKIGFNMASIADVRAEYKAYASELKDARDAALALAKTNADKADASAKALAQALDDDAADDLKQLASAQQEDADAFASDLKALKDADLPTPPKDAPAAGDGVDEGDSTAPVQPEPTPVPDEPIVEPASEEAGTGTDEVAGK